MRLTFTITNTTDLAAKPGWSFTDDLSNGLSPANDLNTTSDCTNGTASASGGNINVAGTLAAGQTSCTVAVDVVVTNNGKLQNNGANIKSPLGVIVPSGTATLTAKALALPAKVIVDPPNPNPGEPFKITAKIKNRSEATLKNVMVCAKVSPGVAVSSGKPKPKRKNGQYCWTIKKLAPGTVTRTLSATLSSSACGQTAQVTVSGPGLKTTRTTKRLTDPCPGGVTG